MIRIVIAKVYHLLIKHILLNLVDYGNNHILPFRNIIEGDLPLNLKKFIDLNIKIIGNCFSKEPLDFHTII